MTPNMAIQNNMKISSNILFLCILFYSTISYAEIITKTISFDPAPIPTGSRAITSYTESGYFFSTPIWMGHCGGANNSNFMPNNGTGYLNFGVNSLPLTIVRIDKRQPVFSLIQVDLAHYSLYFSTNIVEFKGIHTDGSVTYQNFELTDGINFKTFVFNPGFSDLVSVEINSVGYAMDNVLMSTNMPPLPKDLFLPAILQLLLK